MSRRKAIEQAARAERVSVILRCQRCDPCGWRLSPDDTAVRCDHGAPVTPPEVRDITEPIHQPHGTDLGR